MFFLCSVLAVAECPVRVCPTRWDWLLYATIDIRFFSSVYFGTKLYNVVFICIIMFFLMLSSIRVVTLLLSALFLLSCWYCFHATMKVINCKYQKQEKLPHSVHTQRWIRTQHDHAIVSFTFRGRIWFWIWFSSDLKYKVKPQYIWQ